jgi:hypothetical protein
MWRTPLQYPSLEEGLLGPRHFRPTVGCDLSFPETGLALYIMVALPPTFSVRLETCYHKVQDKNQRKQTALFNTIKKKITKDIQFLL